MKNEITFTTIEFLANGLMVATFCEVDGTGHNMAHFDPDGTLRKTIMPRPAGMDPLRDLTAQEVIGAVSMSTKLPRNLVEFGIACDRMIRIEKDPSKRLRWRELRHFAWKAGRGQ